ncbi:hypothetical protein BAE44_0019479, partial [Dichanthelium oligosanthes]
LAGSGALPRPSQRCSRMSSAACWISHMLAPVLPLAPM